MLADGYLSQPCITITIFSVINFIITTTEKLLPTPLGYHVIYHNGQGRGVGTPYNSLYREALLERGSSSRPQVYKRVGISLVEVYERVFRTDAPYGCIISFIRQCMKMTRRFPFLGIYSQYRPVIKVCEMCTFFFN